MINLEGLPPFLLRELQSVATDVGGWREHGPQCSSFSSGDRTFLASCSGSTPPHLCPPGTSGYGLI